MKSAPDNLKTQLTEIAAELSEIVKEIEAQPPRTLNRYDQYLSVFSKVDTDNKKLFFALAMIKAGGSKAGIMAALEISTGKKLMEPPPSVFS